MSRIRKLVAPILATLLCLAPLGFAAEITAPAVPPAANYRTATVRLDNYVKTSTTSGTVVYPRTANVRYEGVTARFVEFKVTRGDAVKEGDVVATVSVEASMVDIENRELRLTRAGEAYVKGKADRQEALQKANETLATLTDPFDQQAQRIAVDKLTLEYQLYCLQTENDMRLQKKALDEQRALHTNTELRAPFDGTIDDLPYKRPGEPVYNYETLATMHSNDEVLIKIDNGNLNFRYNMPVQVQTGNRNERVTLTGRVVVADDVIPEAQRKGYALVALDPGQEYAALKQLSVSGETYRIDGVLLLPRAGVAMQNGKYSVTKLVDGTLKKRYVVFGYSNITDTWLLSGVSEGDVVILD